MSSYAACNSHEPSLIIVPVGYAHPTTSEAGTLHGAPGASSVSNNQAAPSTADDPEVARFQRRGVAGALQAAGIAATKRGEGDQIGTEGS